MVAKGWLQQIFESCKGDTLRYRHSVTFVVLLLVHSSDITSCCAELVYSTDISCLGILRPGPQFLCNQEQFLGVQCRKRLCLKSLELRVPAYGSHRDECLSRSADDPIVYFFHLHYKLHALVYFKVTTFSLSKEKILLLGL